MVNYRMEGWCHISLIPTLAFTKSYFKGIEILKSLEKRFYNILALKEDGPLFKHNI